MRDQAQRLRELARTRQAAGPVAADRARVLAVTSGKGGVGKTSLVANLAVALSGRGRQVVVLDADFGLANLDILLNLNPARNLGHLLRGEARPEEIPVEVLPGLRVIPGASGVEELADLDPAARERLVAEAGRLAAGAEFFLIDTAAGIGRNVVDLCAAAREVWVVTNAEPTALTDAYGLIKVLWAREPEARVGVVVNSADDEAAARAVFGRLDEVVRRFLGRAVEWAGYVVRDEHVARAARRQAAFVSAFPRSPAARCVQALADRLLGREAEARGTGGFWRRLAGRDA